MIQVAEEIKQELRMPLGIRISQLRPYERRLFDPFGNFRKNKIIMRKSFS